MLSQCNEKVLQGYRYVEGVITNKVSGLQISHAWNIDPAGNHVDFTILETNEFIYNGVVIPQKLLSQIGFKNGGIWYCHLPYINVIL